MSWQDIRAWLLAAWETVRRWLRVAWVCRVGVASCVVGFILLRFVVQARDLFLEFPSFDPVLDTHVESYVTMVGYAVRFGALTLVFWALPVHATARLALNRSEWLTSPCGAANDPANLAAARLAFERPVTLVPRLLGAFCFVAAALSIGHTIDDLLPTASRITSQFAKTALLLYLGSIAIFGVMFWVLSDRRRKWLWRAMGHRLGPGGAPVVRQQPPVALGRSADDLIDTLDGWVLAVVFLLLVAILAIPDVLDFFPRLSLIPLLLGAWVPLLGWLGRMAHVTRVPLITVAIALLAIVTYWIGDNHDVTPRPGTQATQLGLRDAVTAWKAANGCTDKPCPSPIIVASAGGASRAAFMTASTLGLLLDASCLDPARPDQNKSPPETAIDAAAEPGCKGAPAFGRRLFAISSVSGGSVGASVYARAYLDGQAQAGRPPADHATYAVPCTRRASTLWFGHDATASWRGCLQAILSEDFLSPVFAGLGFRDVFSFIGKLTEDGCPNLWPDRGHRIEEAWIGAYDMFVNGGANQHGSFKCTTPTSDKGLAAAFTALAPTAPDKAPWRPLLLLNSTSVDTGRRVIGSHLVPDYLSDADDGAQPCLRLFSDAYDLNQVISGWTATPKSVCATSAPPLNDLTLAGATHNSARFPVVSPAGSLVSSSRGASLGRVVDGGYFENYGALTAFDLVDTLRWEYDLFPFVLLVTNDPSDNPDAPVDGARPTLDDLALAWYAAPPAKIESPARVFGSVLAAPVDTVLATRSGHGTTAIKLMRGLIDPAVYQACTKKGARENQCPQVSSELPPRAAPVPTQPSTTEPQAAAPTNPTCFGILGDENPAEDGDGGDKKATPVRRQEPCFAHIGVFADNEATTVTDISMSWWLSKPVQEYLDVQLSKGFNVRALNLVCAAITRASPGATDVAGADREMACRNRLHLLVEPHKPTRAASSR